MKTNAYMIQRLVISSAFAASLLSAGVAASAQTTATPVATPAAATNVALSTVDSKAKREIRFEQDNAEARRVEFRNLGTSL